MLLDCHEAADEAAYAAWTEGHPAGFVIKAHEKDWNRNVRQLL
jgi:hypothetical protein